MKLIAALSISFLLCVPLLTFAAGYQPLAPVPGLTESNPDFVGPPDQSLSGYLKKLYNFAIGAAAALAVIMVIWGGVEYMTTDAIGHSEEGKQKIQNAVLGLLLALSTYIILQTINRDLLSLNFDPKLEAISKELLEPIEVMQIETAPKNTGYVVNAQGKVSASQTNVPNIRADGVNQNAIQAAMTAFNAYGSKASNQEYIGVMDYSQPNSSARFYIINTQTGEISASKAAHGYNSDPGRTGIASQFSNADKSFMSSLGAFIAEPYYSEEMGKNALKLKGLQPGVNDNAATRGLAIHSADYVTQDSCGMSGGCIAYPNELESDINKKLSNAFIYSYK
ncbi:MAG: murein L,D-transpeptidase catalytic domain-containing protein [Candidatus Paceibacterota bacterium]